MSSARQNPSDQCYRHGDAVNSPHPPVVFRSDRGSQYTSYACQRYIKNSHLISGMSEVGSCADNAAADISVTKLDSSKLLLSSGADYNNMCAGCHLKPGKDKSDLSIGLYPVPPNLSLPNAHADHDHGHDENYALQRRFRIIKHGIKASAMPAWGPTHSDERILAMAAFLQ